MYRHSPLLVKDKSFSTAVSITASFGCDSSPILPRHIQCIGDERTLSNCSNTDYDPEQCHQIAGVICEGLIIEPHCVKNNNTNCYNNLYYTTFFPILNSKFNLVQ